LRDLPSICDNTPLRITVEDPSSSLEKPVLALSHRVRDGLNPSG
jgi:hypothetical protein